MCYLESMQETSLTLTERQEIANAFLAKVKEEAGQQAFADHWELGYLRATLENLICKFPEVANTVK